MNSVTESLGYILVRLFESAMFCALLNCVLTKRYEFRLHSAAVTASMTVLSIVTGMLTISSTVVDMTLNVSLDLLIVCLFYSDSLLRKVQYTAIFYAFMFLCDVVSYLGGTLLGILEMGPIEQIESIPLYLRLLSRTFLPVCNKLYLRIREKKELKIKPSLSIPIPVFFCAFNITFNPWGTEENLYNTSPLLFYFVCVVLAGSCMVFAVALIQLITRETRYKAELKFRAEQERYYKAMEAEISRLRGLIHDFNNLLKLVSSTEEGKANAERIRHRLAGRLVETGNVHLDNILTIKKDDLELRGVSMEVCGILPECFPWLDPIDLTIILGNALDNAANALSKMAPEQRSPVKVDLSYKDKVLVITVNNNVAPNVIIDFNPTKKAPGHGNGIKNIQYAVDLYQGYLRYSHNTENNTVTMTAMVQNLPDQ